MRIRDAVAILVAPGDERAGDLEVPGEGDLDAARELVTQAGATARAELFTYPGDRHLFTDRSLPGHDAAAAELVTARVLAFLAALG